MLIPSLILNLIRKSRLTKLFIVKSLNLLLYMLNDNTDTESQLLTAVYQRKPVFEGISLYPTIEVDTFAS